MHAEHLIAIVLLAATACVRGGAPVSDHRTAAPSPEVCVAGEGQIAVFADQDLRGACAVLGAGDFSKSRELQIENDSISSVHLGPHAQALLCEHDDWGGACERVTTDIVDLTGSRVGNDAVSSIRVVRAGTDCVVRGAPARFAGQVGSLETRCAEAYPQILELLATDAVFTPPLVITFSSLETFTAETRGRDVFIDENRWDPADLGILYHELTHVVTMYPDAPSWLSEGMADYVRGTLEGWSEYHCRGEESYTAGYGCAASLLKFVEQGAPGAMRSLHASLRARAFDGTIAGRAVEELWDACRHEGTCVAR